MVEEPTNDRMPQEPEVAWLCERCSTPIAGDEGYVFISNPEVAIAEAEQRANRAGYEELRRDSPLGIIRMSDDWETPEPAPWHIIHSVCGEEDDRVGRNISISRLSTYRDLLRWTTHLLEKRWLPATNWLAMMDGATSRGKIGGH